MLTRIRRWLKDAARKSQAHKAAWIPALSSVGNGLAQFQASLANDIRTTIKAQCLEFEERIVESAGHEADPESHFEFRIMSHQTQIWLHGDSFTLRGPVASAHFEHWDFDSPEELGAELLARLRDNLAATNPADA